MVSRDIDSRMVEMMAMGVDEVPGSAILTARQIEERPHRDFLMHQQGFLSGKTEGDLDSVPGYYGGTASYKFVQNAKHLNKLRVTRYKLNYTLGEHYDEYGRVVSDSPASKIRMEAYEAAKAVPSTPYSSVGPDMAFKHAGEHGAFVPNAFGMRAGLPGQGAFAVPSSHLTSAMHKPVAGFKDGVYVPNIYVPPSHLSALLNPPRSEAQRFLQDIDAPRPLDFYNSYGGLKKTLIAQA
jgi:hypothetical protein